MACCWLALARLTQDGKVARPDTIALLDRFEHENLAPPRDWAWKGWQDAIVLLGVEELSGRLRATWEDGRNRERTVDRTANMEALLEAHASQPGDATRFVERGIAPIDDPIAALAWIAPPRDRTEDAVSRSRGESDPAAGIALPAEELDWL